MASSSPAGTVTWCAVRGAFIIDAHDREIIAWCSVANAGISGSDVRDMMLAALVVRFGGYRARH
jgi:putative transposase